MHAFTSVSVKRGLFNLPDVDSYKSEYPRADIGNPDYKRALNSVIITLEDGRLATIDTRSLKYLA